MSKWSAVAVIRTAFWIVATLIGAAQIWVARHYVNPDGVSYIEIATRYLQHDWTNALNTYWSPLYSWGIALAFFILRPSAYWEVATAHLVIFAAYIGALLSFEFFLFEAVALSNENSLRSYGRIPASTIYIAGYSAFLYTTLSLVVIVFCAPDMIAFALLIAIMALLLRVRRTGGSNLVFASLGIACALSYLDRTAFAPSTLACLAVLLIILHAQKRPLLRPALIVLVCALTLVGPFILAISQKSREFTIGKSGKLNYGWEVDGARHFIHWQGEPFNLGTPTHPTKRISSLPEAFTFAQPIPASYPPWYDPSYWYDGIEPKLHLKSQLRTAIVNFSVACHYLVKFPVFLLSCFFIVLSGLRGWRQRIFAWWPVLVPALFGIALYCLVFVENRYIAANLLLIWIAFLVSVPLPNEWLRKWCPRLLALFALVFSGNFLRHYIAPVKECLRDLKHHEERWWNVDYLLAERLSSLGLRPGDKVAYIGRTMDVEWARLGHFQIIGEVPIVYSRFKRLFDNSLIEDTGQIEAFWKTDEATRTRLLQAFREAGARVVVTDGYYCAQFSARWPRLLPLDQPHVPGVNPPNFSQANSRYLLLTPYF